MASYEGLTGEKLLKRAKACFKAASDAEQKQREREREDLEFQIADNQWDPEARRFRKGTPTSPPRPMLSVSLLSQPMALIQNQAVAAKLGVEIHPVSEAADPEVAEVKQGLYRRIERDSNAQIARLWALDRAKQCGRGWYRVNTQWDEDGDDPSDQEIVIERILNQENVYIDPAAQKPDFSDAQWGMIVSYVDVDTFEAMYPGKEFPTDDTTFKAWETEDPEWVNEDGKLKAVRVAEYFWKETKRETVKKGKLYQRERENVRVRLAHISAKEVLAEYDWNGRYIPLIPVIGTELQPFDGQRIWEGMVRKARDAQKFFNFSISTLVERMAMEPRAPFVGAEGQFEGHEEEWTLANVRNQPFLEYKPTSVDGNLNPPPARSQVDSSGMSLALMALDQARQFVQSATSVYAPSLGEVPQERSAQSGRAIVALQQQSDAGTSHFLQNLANISMQYEARVIMDLMPAVYDRPGRVVQVLGAEDEPRTVMLNRPFVEKDGQAIPMPPQGQPPPVDVQPEQIKTYDLAKGKYTVSVSVGKSFQTRLQEGATEIGAVLQAAPALMPIIGPTYFRFRDFPGAKEIADLLKKMREKQYPGLDGKEGEGPTPEQLKGQLQQMQQQMQMQGQALQQAMMELKTKQAEQQAAMMKAQLDAQTTMGKAQLDADTKLRISAAENETKLILAKMQESQDAILTLLKLQGEAEKIERQAIRDDEQAEAGRVHEVVMGELGRPEPKEEPAEVTE